MNHGRTIFAQLLDFLPFKHFEYLVEKFSANHAVKSFSAWSHFLCLAYAQLTQRAGLLSFDWRRLGRRSRDLGQVFKQRRGAYRKLPVKQ